MNSQMMPIMKPRFASQGVGDSLGLVNAARHRKNHKLSAKERSPFRGYSSKLCAQTPSRSEGRQLKVILRSAKERSLADGCLARLRAQGPSRSDWGQMVTLQALLNAQACGSDTR
jgi:hypothetical protein